MLCTASSSISQPSCPPAAHLHLRAHDRQRLRNRALPLTVGRRTRWQHASVPCAHLHLHPLLPAPHAEAAAHLQPPTPRSPSPSEEQLPALALRLLDSSMHLMLPPLQALEADILQLSSAGCTGPLSAQLAHFLELTTHLHSVASGIMLLLQHTAARGTGTGEAAAPAPHAAGPKLAARAEEGMEHQGARREVLTAERAGKEGDAVQQVLKACAQLLVHVGSAQQRVLGSTQVYAALVSEATAQGRGMDTSGAAQQQQQQQQHTAGQIQLQLLLQRFQQQGYHPSRGGASYSVAMSRKDKLQHLADLRQQERVLVQQVQHELYSREACPEVELCSQDLAEDTLLAAMFWQQQQQQQQAPLDPHNTNTLLLSLDLDLASSSQLLRLHTDRAVRQQVYEQAVQARCLQVLDHMDRLADVRRKVALTHDLGSYSELAHMDTLAGGYSPAASLLLELARELRPLVAQEVEGWQEHMPGLDIQPWDLEWLSQQVCTGASGSSSSSSSTAGDHSWLQGLCLEDVVQGLSTFLSSVMGVTLVRERQGSQAPPHLDPAGPACPRPGDVEQQHSHPRACSAEALDQLLAHLSSRQDQPPSSSSSTSGGCAVYSVLVEGRGLVGQLVLLPQGGFGTRYLTHGLGGPGGREPAVAAAPGNDAQASATASSRSGAHSGHGSKQPGGVLGAIGTEQAQQEQPNPQQHGCPPVVLLGLHWPQHTWRQADSGGMDMDVDVDLHAAAASLHELIHELGHGLHFLLSSGSGDDSGDRDSQGHWKPLPGVVDDKEGSDTNQQQQQQPELSTCTPWPGAGDLALELKELPSTLFELLLMRPDALSYLLPAGADPHVMSRRMRRLAYSPVQFQIQVLTMLLDQMLLSQPTQQRRQQQQHTAHELWERLCMDFLPGLNPGFTVQQAMSLTRVVEAQGQAYAYTAAWCLACQVLERSGLGPGAVQPELGRQLRRSVWEVKPSEVSGARWVEQLTGSSELAALVEPRVLEKYLSF